MFLKKIHKIVISNSENYPCGFPMCVFKCLCAWHVILVFCVCEHSCLLECVSRIDAEPGWLDSGDELCLCIKVQDSHWARTRTHAHTRTLCWAYCSVLSRLLFFVPQCKNASFHMFSIYFTPCDQLIRNTQYWVGLLFAQKMLATFPWDCGLCWHDCMI